MAFKIAVLDDYQNIALEVADWSILSDDADITVFEDNIADLETLVKRLEPFEVLAAMRERTPFPRALIEKLPNLKLLITTGMRNGSFDLTAATDHGVTVCGTGGQAAATVEMIWALIQSLVRNIPQEQQAMREGKWQTRIGKSLAGRTLGLVGLGNLGSRTAAIANFFDMRVIAWSENLTIERAEFCKAELVSKDELFGQSDIVSIHLLLSKRSRGLIGRGELALMKPDAYLVNTSRGPIVDEVALLDVLQNNRIAGAALDVYDQEPLPKDHPLLSLENTLLSPHMAYVTEENLRLFYSETVEDIAAWISGRPIRVLASPE